MGLANYFSKNLLALNRLINTDLSILEDTLENYVVTIAFDKNCLETREGEVGIEMLVRLIARLYPKIKIVDLSGTKNAINRHGRPHCYLSGTKTKFTRSVRTVLRI